MGCGNNGLRQQQAAAIVGWPPFWGQPAIAAAPFWGHPAIAAANPLLPQPTIAASNFDIVLEYLDGRTNLAG